MATIRPAGLDRQYVVVLPYEFDARLLRHV
jgi:hypothetical protein